MAACAIDAWSTDDDPNGLNIRAGPRTDAAIIGRIPPPVEVEGDEFAAEISITGSKEGWFRIESAIVIDYIGDEETKAVFEGTGWISGRFLGLGLNYQHLHRGPSRSTPVVAHLSGEDAEGWAAGPDTFIVERLHACRGNWVEVEGTFLGARRRGWADRTCANQVTTCP